MPIIDEQKLSSEITDTYFVKDNTFFAVEKYEPMDLVEKEIGDSKQAEFYPQQKITRWDNEVNVSARLVHDELTPTVSTLEDKIVWEGDKVAVNFYDLPIDEINSEGASEFEVILKEKPKSNIVQFTLVDKGVEYYYQDSLVKEETGKHPDNYKITDTEVLDEEGNQIKYRPENVVGSYAVYASENKINYVGGKEYKCGQVGMIYRPRIEDANGDWIWGELHIENGILSVTIPQEFLDKAIYPVRHAAGLTFGYTTAGASSYTVSVGGMRVKAFAASQYTASAGDTVTNFTASVKYNISGATVGAVLYTFPSTVPVTKVGTEGTITTTSSKAWRDSQAISVSLSAGTKYTIAYGHVLVNPINLYYTSVADSFSQHNSFTTFPATWSELSKLSEKYSVYATYTAGGGTTNVTVNATIQSYASSQLTPTITATASDVTVQATLQSAISATLSTVISAVRNISLTAGILTTAFTGLSPTVTAETSTSISVSPNVEYSTYSTPPPEVSAIRNKSVSPNVEESTFSTVQPSLSYNDNEQVSCALQASQFSILSPTITAQKNVSTSTSIQTAQFSSIDPNVSAVRNVSNAGAIQASTFSTLDPTINTVRNISNPASILSSTYSQPVISVSTVKNISVYPVLEAGIMILIQPSLTYNDNESIVPGIQTGEFSQPEASVSSVRNVATVVAIQEGSFNILEPQVTGTHGSIHISVNADIQSSQFFTLIPTITTSNSINVTVSIGGSAIVDSYSESNGDEVVFLYEPESYFSIGQSFYGDGGTLHSCKFDLKKYGSPTGNMSARIYAHAGTFGSTGKGTGSALATSDTIDISTLTTSYQLVTFTFSGADKITLENGTAYVVVVYYYGGNSTNALNVHFDDVSAVNDGNMSGEYSGGWIASATADVCFYVYKEAIDLPSSAFSILAPTITAVQSIDISVNADIQSATCSDIVSSVSITRNKTISPNIETAQFSTIQPSLTLNDSEQISAGIQAAIYSQPDASVSAVRNASTLVDIQTGTLSVIEPSISLEDTEAISVSLSSAIFSVLDPTVSTTRQVSITPDIEIGSFSTINPTLTIGSSVSIAAGINESSLSTISPTVSTQKSISINVGLQEGSFNTLNPTITTTQAQQALVEPDPLEITVSVLNPTIKISATASPALQSFSFSSFSPTISTTRQPQISAQIQTSTFSIIQPSISGQRHVSLSLNLLSIAFSQPTTTIAAYGKNPYHKGDNPHTKKAGIYSGKSNPYSQSTQPYSNKNIYRNFPKI